MEPILPGSYLGILGGGQLGRMFTQAAQAMGYKVCVLDPSSDSPAGSIAEKFIQADYADSTALKEMAALCAAVSTEFENVPAQALDDLESLGVFVAPRSSCVSLAQNRIEEKKFLATWKSETNIGPAPYFVIEHDADIAHAPTDLFPGILKTARMGYDGKGQIRVAEPGQISEAWHQLGRQPSIVEAVVNFDAEFSVILVRNTAGDIRYWDSPRNRHEGGILSQSTLPAGPLIESQVGVARALAAAAAEKLDFVGVMTMEFFATADGPLFNEMAPRVHNSGHWTIEGAATSQFENHIRAVCNLPLGATELVAERVEMANLIGADADRWPMLFADNDAHVHLYGKGQASPGRKMGHVTRLYR
jgi:5-(carboxyamino)imidazole ribonucleotide synthase